MPSDLMRLLIAVAREESQRIMYDSYIADIKVSALRCVTLRQDVTASVEKRATGLMAIALFFSFLFFFNHLSLSLSLSRHSSYLPTWVICISDVAWRFAGESAASISSAGLFAPSFVRRTSHMRICAYTCAHSLCTIDKNKFPCSRPRWNSHKYPWELLIEEKTRRRCAQCTDITNRRTMQLRSNVT